MTVIPNTAAPVWSDAAQLVNNLSDELGSFEWTAADSVCSKLIDRLNNSVEPFPEDPAKQILSRLRRKRQFRMMELVADALIRSGQSSPQVRRQYAQAMIDQGNLTSAEMVLNSLLADSKTPTWERAEANGLLGRIYKQLFVQANDPHSPRQQENVRKAIAYYQEVYRSNPQGHPWHGINTVALLARARRDELSIGEADDEQQLADQILTAILQKPDAEGVTPWDRATAAEACIAMNRFADAGEHLLYFVSDPAVDAFEIASLLRQLTEVWQIASDSGPAAVLLTALRAALLKREGGQVELQQRDIAGGLEAVFGHDRYEPFSWFQTGLKRCTAVARIEDIAGRRIGTGFLLEAADFFDDSVDGPVLLTNAHVISPASDPYPGSIRPETASAVFEALGTSYRISKLLWSSPVAKLDATLVTLEKMPPSASPCPLKPQAEPFVGTGKQRVYVIGYPLGGVLSISLHDSTWLDADDTFLHYRTPTEPGSSGSPVFDQKYWTLIGLHHRGKTNTPRLHGLPGTYEANEAISITTIRQAIRESIKGRH
jgi:tetratricopeptide (TPR) repeat protein